MPTSVCLQPWGRAGVVGVGEDCVVCACQGACDSQAVSGIRGAAGEDDGVDVSECRGETRETKSNVRLLGSVGGWLRGGLGMSGGYPFGENGRLDGSQRLYCGAW